ncbi:CocE/NonD family hydrolase [Acinetobacter thermotolerans]|uniref:CocE/NonD family hydrolase n=1 Tax=Acinetobacter thermotolerans TaxID=3151487 RepID=UPI00325BF0B7
MTLLNKLYAAIAATVTVVAVTVGVVNKVTSPTQQVDADLNYLQPQVLPVSTGSSSSYTTTLKNTKLGTRQFQSQAQTPVSDNANARWSNYTRDYQYPNMVTLPVQWLSMRDGTRIAVRVTLPADENKQPIYGKFPVILIQTAYNTGLAGQIADMAGGPNPEFVRRGYATVVADVRGTGSSEGVWQAFDETEQEDSKEIIDWASKQYWSNGKIGLYGVSYLGITSLLGASTQHPAVKAAFPMVPIGDGYRDILFNGGQLNTNFIPLWMSLVGLLGALPVDALQVDPVNGIVMGLDKIQNMLFEFQLPLTFQALQGTDTAFDSDFWRQRSPLEYAHKIKVPTFVVGGTRDLFQRSEPLWLEALKDQTTAKILIGPWNHLQAALGSTSGNGDVPAVNNIALQWFDQYLKGIDTNAEKLPNVTQWVYGHEKFVTSTDWPHIGIQPDRLYLNSLGKLVTNKSTSSIGESFLLEAPTFGICSNTVETVTIGVAAILPFPCLQNNNMSNIPAAVFNSDTLQNDYYLNGPIQADLWVSSSAPDMGLVVRIADVDPKTGNAKALSTGILTASLRKVDETRSRYINGVMMQPWHTFKKEDVQPLEKNKPVLMNIEIAPVAALIPKGHQLQISVVASDIWKGVAPLPTLKSTLNGSISIYSNSKYPSSVVLPKVSTQYLNP